MWHFGFLGKPSFKFLIFITLAVVSVFSLMSYQEQQGFVTPLSRFESTTGTDENGTALHRLVTYGLALEEIKENPFIGVGYDEISNKTSNGFPVHNMYLASLFEGGILSLFGMLLITGSIVYFATHAVRYAPSKLHYNMSLGLLIAFISAIVFGMTAPFYINDTYGFQLRWSYLCIGIHWNIKNIK